MEENTNDEPIRIDLETGGVNLKRATIIGHAFIGNVAMGLVKLQMTDNVILLDHHYRDPITNEEIPHLILDSCTDLKPSVDQSVDSIRRMEIVAMADVSIAINKQHKPFYHNICKRNKKKRW